MYKRLTALFLAICMTFSMLPVQAFAAEGDPTEPSETSVVETTAPTEAPTEAPTSEPTEAPTSEPTEAPTTAPASEPTEVPTEAPTEEPTSEPTEVPTEAPAQAATEEPVETTEETVPEPETLTARVMFCLGDGSHTDHIVDLEPDGNGGYQFTITMADADTSWADHRFTGWKYENLPADVEDIYYNAGEEVIVPIFGEPTDGVEVYLVAQYVYEGAADTVRVTFYADSSWTRWDALLQQAEDGSYYIEVTAPTEEELDTYKPGNTFDFYFCHDVHCQPGETVRVPAEPGFPVDFYSCYTEDPNAPRRAHVTFEYVLDNNQPVETVEVVSNGAGGWVAVVTMPEADNSRPDYKFIGWEHKYHDQIYQAGETVSLPVQSDDLDPWLNFAAVYEFVGETAPETLAVYFKTANAPTLYPALQRNEEDGTYFIEFQIPTDIDVTPGEGWLFVGWSCNYDIPIQDPGATVRMTVDPAKPVYFVTYVTQNQDYTVRFNNNRGETVHEATVTGIGTVGEANMPPQSVIDAIMAQEPEGAVFVGWHRWREDGYEPFTADTKVYYDEWIYPDISYEGVTVAGVANFHGGRNNDVIHTFPVDVVSDGANGWQATLTLPEADNTWADHQFVGWRNSMDNQVYDAGATVTVPSYYDSDSESIVYFEAVYNFVGQAPAEFDVLFYANDPVPYREMTTPLLQENGSYYVELTLPEDLTAPPTIEDGLVHVGWFTLNDYKIHQAGDTVRLNVDLATPVRVYARYSDNVDHTVCFMDANGMYVHQVTVPFGEPLGGANMPGPDVINKILANAPAGSILSGWYIDWGNDIQVPFDPDEPVYENVWLKPTITERTTYSAFFSITNGTFEGGKFLLEVQVPVGQPLPVDQVPVPVPDEGYVGDGWYVRSVVGGESVETPIDAPDTVNPMNAHVQYTYKCVPQGEGEVSRTVTFRWPEGQETRTVLDGHTLAQDGLTLPTTTESDNDGWVFTGWVTEVGSLPFDENTVVTEDLVVIPQHHAAYVITFEGGAVYEVIYGNAIGTLPTHTDPGFQGWFAMVEDQEVQVTPDMIPTSDLTVYAKVRAAIDYSIDFVVDGVSETVSQTSYEETCTLTVPAAPVKDGFEFKGWSLEEGGEIAFAPTAETITLTENNSAMTLYAVWEDRSITYTVNFVVDGETESVSQRTAEDTCTLNAIPAPSKEGFVFKGWSFTENGQVEVAADTATIVLPRENPTWTLYAVWQRAVNAVFSGGRDGFIMYEMAVALEGDETSGYQITFTMPDADNDWANHRFLGWKDYVTGETYDAGAEVTIPWAYSPETTAVYFDAVYEYEGAAPENFEVLIFEFDDTVRELNPKLQMAEDGSYFVEFQLPADLTPPPAAEEGTVFAGWFNDYDYKYHQPGDNIRLTVELVKPVRFYAYFETPTAHTVYFLDLGGNEVYSAPVEFGQSLGEANLPPQNVLDAILADAPENSEISGWYFVWDGDVQVPFDANDPMYTDIWLWPDITEKPVETKTVQIIFLSNGSPVPGFAVPVAPDGSGNYTATFTLPAGDDGWEGREFTGWRDAMSGIVYNAGEEITIAVPADAVENGSNLGFEAQYRFVGTVPATYEIDFYGFNQEHLILTPDLIDNGDETYYVEFLVPTAAEVGIDDTMNGLSFAGWRRNYDPELYQAGTTVTLDIDLTKTVEFFPEYGASKGYLDARAVFRYGDGYASSYELEERMIPNEAGDYVVTFIAPELGETWEGHAFTGWNLGGTLYAPGDEITLTVPAANASDGYTVYAMAQYNEIVEQLHAKVFFGIGPNGEHPYDQDVTLDPDGQGGYTVTMTTPPAHTGWEGREFVGWKYMNIDEEVILGGGETVTFNVRSTHSTPEPVDGMEIIFFAQYEFVGTAPEEYTVYLCAAHEVRSVTGKLYQDGENGYYVEFTIPADVDTTTGDDRIFAGWRIDGMVYQPGQSVRMSVDLGSFTDGSVYPEYNFAVNTCTVYFADSNGELIYEAQVNAGQSLGDQMPPQEIIDQLEDEAGEGAQFEGWYTCWGANEEHFAFDGNTPVTMNGLWVYPDFTYHGAIAEARFCDAKGNYDESVTAFVDETESGNYRVTLTAPDGLEWEDRVFTHWQGRYEIDFVTCAAGEEITFTTSEFNPDWGFEFIARYEYVGAAPENWDFVYIKYGEELETINLELQQDKMGYFADLTLPTECEPDEGLVFSGWRYTDPMTGWDTTYNPGQHVRLRVDPAVSDRGELYATFMQEGEQVSVYFCYRHNDLIEKHANVGQGLGDNMPTEQEIRQLLTGTPEGTKVIGWYYTLPGSDEKRPFDENTPVMTWDLRVYPRLDMSQVEPAPVTLRYYDGSGNEPIQQTAYVDYDSDGNAWITFTTPAAPAKENCRFVGWEEKSGKNNAIYGANEKASMYVSNETLGRNATIYFEVKYEYTGAIPKTVPVTCYAYNTQKTLNPALKQDADGYYVEFTIPSMSKEVPAGQVYVGWYIGEDGKYYQNGDKVRMAIDLASLWGNNIYVYSAPTGIKYQINFNGFQAGKWTVELEAGKPIGAENMPPQSMIDAIMERQPEGAKFGGWAANWVGNGKIFYDETSIVMGEMWLDPVIILPEYEVVFSIENGVWLENGQSYLFVKVPAGECLKEEDIPTPVPNDGYTIAGWYDFEYPTAAPSTTKPINFDHNYDLKCKPAIKKNVQFFVDGSLVEVLEAFENESLASAGLTLPVVENDPADGRIFSGWYVAGTDTVFTEDTVITQAVKVEARFADAYVVTFQGHEPFEVLPGTVLGYAEEMADGLYAYDAPNFKGWFATVNGEETRITLYTKVNCDLNIVPKLAEMFTVTFKDAVDADYAVIENVVSGTALGDRMPAAPAAPDDYVFDGWMANGRPFTGTTTITGNTLVTPKWKAKEITVELRSGADTIYGTFKLTAGTKLDLPTASEIPSPANMICTGWTIGDQMLENGGSYGYEDMKDLADWNDNGTAKCVLMAKHEYLYTVTFDHMDGSDKETVTWTSETPAENIVEPAAAHTRPGFEFMGWSKNKTSVLDELTVGAEEFNVTFYTVWKNICTVTFVDFEGNQVAEYSVPAGGKVPEVPEISAPDAYHIASGWMVGDKPFTADRVITGDLTVTYTVKPVKVELSFVTNLNQWKVDPTTIDADDHPRIWTPEVPKALLDGIVFSGWAISGDIDLTEEWIVGENEQISVNDFVDHGARIGANGLARITLTTVFEEPPLPVVEAVFNAGENNSPMATDDSYKNIQVVKNRAGECEVTLTLPEPGEDVAWADHQFVGWKYNYNKQIYQPGEELTLPTYTMIEPEPLVFFAVYEFTGTVVPETFPVEFSGYVTLNPELKGDETTGYFVEFQIPADIDLTGDGTDDFIGWCTEYHPGEFYQPGEMVRIDVDLAKPIVFIENRGELKTKYVYFHDLDSMQISRIAVGFGRAIGNTKMPGSRIEANIKAALPEGAEFLGWASICDGVAVPFTGTSKVYEDIWVYPNISYAEANVTASVAFLTGMFHDVAEIWDVSLTPDGTGAWLANFTMPETLSNAATWENHVIIGWEDTRNGAIYEPGETVSLTCWLGSTGVQLDFEAVYAYDETAEAPETFDVILRSQANTDINVYAQMAPALQGDAETGYFVEFTIPKDIKVSVPRGYLFGGWKTLYDSALYQPGDVIRMPVENLAEPIWLYAYNVKAAAHTVSFYNDIGDLIRTVTASYGRAVGTANMPTQRDIDQIMARQPAGSEFSWVYSYESNDYVEMPFTATTPVKSNLRVYPKVETSDLTITFIIENGVWASRDQASTFELAVPFGDPLNPLYIPIPAPLDGYRAGKWYLQTESGEEELSGIPTVDLMDRDFVFVHRCEPIEYKAVNFQVRQEDDTYVTIHSETVMEGTTVTALPELEESIDGRIFKCWHAFVKSGENIYVQVEFDADTVVTDDFVNAPLSEDTVTEDFVDVTAYYVPACVVSVEGFNVFEVLPGTTLGDMLPERSDPGFLGWVAQIDGEETQVTKETVVNSDMNIVAKMADPVTITFDRQELLLNLRLAQMIEAQVLVEGYVEDLELVWSIANMTEPDLVEIEPNDTTCLIRHNGMVGTVDLMVTPYYGGELHPEYAKYCTINIKALEDDAVEDVKLGATSVTAEMNQTGYSTLQLFVKVNEESEMFAANPDLANFMYIDKVEFVKKVDGEYVSDTALAEIFDLMVMDDGQVGIVPKGTASKSSYTAYLRVTVGDGTEKIVGPFKIAVKKTAPRLKASSLSFNSFVSGQTLNLTFSGGNVLSIRKNPGTDTRPIAWREDVLSLDEENFTLSLADGFNGKFSGTISLLVEVEGYKGEWPVKVSVKAAPAQPKVALSASSVTIYNDPAMSQAVSLNLVSKERNKSLDDLHVSDVVLDDGEFNDRYDLAYEGGNIQLTPKLGAVLIAETVYLRVYFGQDGYTDQSVRLALKIRPASVSLKLAKSSLSLNPDVAYSTPVKVTFTPANYDPAGMSWTVTKVENRQPVEATGELNVTFADGILNVATTKETKASTTYTVTVTAGTRTAKLTVKTLAANKTAITTSLKASGFIDLSFPGSEIVVRPSYKNYLMQGSEIFGWSITEKNGRNSEVHVEDQFNVTIDADGTAHVTAKNPQELAKTFNSRSQYYFSLRTTVESGRTTEAKVRVTLKKTAVSLRLAKTSISLNAEQKDEAFIKVTSGTKGFDVGAVKLDVTPTLEGALPLNVDYADGMLHVAVNEHTAPGMTYKVTVTPKVEGAKVATLTVRTPKAGRYSAVTAKIKLSGSIDVIRPGKAITVTPSLSNFLGQPAATRLEFESYDAKTRIWSACNELFSAQPQANGTFAVTPLAGAMSGSKYRVRAAVNLPGYEETIYSGYANMSVKMGSTKLTADKKAVTLYTGDTNARASVLLSSLDKTQTGISKVNVLVPRGYEDAFAWSYNGETNKVTLSIANQENSLLVKARSVKLTIQVTLDGNETGKPNISIPVTVNVLK